MVMVMNPPSSSSERAHLTDGDELTTELGVQSRSISIGVSPGDVQVKPPGPPPNRRDRCCVRTIAAVLACIALVVVFHVAIATWHYFNPAYDGIAEGVPYETARQHEQQPEDLWGAVKRPYPTGAWWTNLVVADGNGPVAPLPYGVMVKRSGVDLSYHGAVKVDPTNVSVTMTVDAQITVGSKEWIASRSVTKYDDLSVTFALYTSRASASRLAEPDGGFDVILARGSPYVTFTYDGATPKILANAEIASFEAVLDVDIDAEPHPTLCASRPACVTAKLHGHCCPLDTGVDHACCAKPVAVQGGSAFRLQFMTGGEWRIYTSSVVSFTWSSTGVVANKPFYGILRVAALPTEPLIPGDTMIGSSNMTEAVREASTTLDTFASTYPIAGTVSVETSADSGYEGSTGDSAKIRFTWQTKSMGDAVGASGAWRGAYAAAKQDDSSLLMLALPHHIDAGLSDSGSSSGAKPLEDAAAATIPFVAIKGPMTPVVGKTWVMEEALTDIGFTAPRAVTNATMTAKIIEQLKIDTASSMRINSENGQLYLDPAGESATHKAAWMVDDPFWGNPYWNGKEMARLALLALVADEFGDTVARQTAVARLTAMLEPWVKGSNADPLMYDPTWGGLCTANGLADHDADFGNGWYNDHHFHYGYFAYAAAVAGKFDTSWFAKYKDKIYPIVYDIASPGLHVTKAFPPARHKDWFDGHSWASGIFFMGQAKSQESTSEAVNAYYGVYLFGMIAEDEELMNWGRTLLATEIRSAQKYWQMTPHSGIYDLNFERKRMAGVVGALSCSCTTWFGDNPAYVHGIQMMPFTPITEELLLPTFVANEYPYLHRGVAAATPEVTDAWHAIVAGDRAVIEPLSAWEQMVAADGAQLDGGTTKSAMLYWVASRPLTTDLTTDDDVVVA